ncbi:uncharacterized protein EAE97_001862 [Botrytis byssoidea]|uniref:Dimethylaniline monooxygenase n=1 Tax=Botrytis byssoidea TaxID=139641 RepID=A0A9P5LYB2_9HELO|nr:uncharacterized protein EAE97_001862 [Botrytis byssoidea]KAF7952365.1 hypothetical protein EAE97_001862 [Botrytis byssoidea]
MTSEGIFDIVIIGAGISGIHAAKFYLDIHLQCRLVILDRDPCVGGVWNFRRGYDSFWTQWTVGTAEFSDLPMTRPPEEDVYYEFFKTKYTTEYLEDYVDTHRYGDTTLRDRIKLSTEVRSLLRKDGKWMIETVDLVSGASDTWQTTKLIVASGLNSIPNMPLLPGKDLFQGPILHQNDFGSSKVLTSPDIQETTVLGAGKSSADMVYSAVKAGKTVSWIIKTSDTNGPGFLLSPKGKGPYKNAFEWTWFLHSTKYGVKMMNAFWSAVDNETRKDADFNGRKNLQGFEKLNPQSPMFWQNCTGGLLHQVDLFDAIAEKVRIYCADIASIEEHKILLKDGNAVPADAILCGTGWVPSLQFFTEDQKKSLGLPHLPSSEHEEHQDHWKQLTSEADQKVVSRFPQLANLPPHYRRPVTHTPYRLYKHVARFPTSDSEIDGNSIVFIGQVSVGDYFPVVQCQSMWATAYLDGKLVLPPSQEQQKEVALFTAWNSRRYLSSGDEGINMTFELVGYCDSLLQDLGLISHRRGWFKDLFAPFVASNFAGLKDEYLKKYESDETKGA